MVKKLILMGKLFCCLKGRGLLSIVKYVKKMK